MRITPCAGATFGATVTDVELNTITPAEWSDLEEAFHQHALLIFPGQQALGARRDRNDGLIEFAARWGSVQNDLQITNLDADTGRVLPLDEYGVRILRGNEDWHADQTFQQVQARAGILFAYETPAAGGETGFADMRAAFRALDAPTRTRVETLSAFHSLKYSTARRGHFPEPPEQEGRPDLAGQRPPSRKRELVPLNDDVWGNNTAYCRPLVKIHPVTREPSLLIGRHAFGIPGMAARESEAFLARLLAEAVQPPRLLAHRWQPGDLVLYDNRCLLHRACDYDGDAPRVLRSVRIAGDPRTEGALASPIDTEELLAQEVERLRVCCCARPLLRFIIGTCTVRAVRVTCRFDYSPLKP